MICFAISTFLASLFTLFAFILELFILIGQLDNRPFLRDMYLGQALNLPQQKYINFNLWNYCVGDVDGSVTGCSRPVPAYNWLKTPVISMVMEPVTNSTITSGLFLALFILIFITCGLSLLLWLASLPVCFLRRRSLGYSMSSLTLINFLIALTAMIIALVITIHGGKVLRLADTNWITIPGNSMWCCIGAVVSLFLAFLLNAVGTCGCRDSKTNGNVTTKKDKKGKKADHKSRFDGMPYATASQPNNPYSTQPIPHNENDPSLPATGYHQAVNMTSIETPYGNIHDAQNAHEVSSLHLNPTDPSHVGEEPHLGATRL
ncbi:hypothetical protein BDF14DRAFT_1822940 [Spinellus fusiger]|nr:hypothetical protein BDF14DRAFT_1822940 [Spinellus fusiger]